MQPATYIIAETDPTSPHYLSSQRNLTRTLERANQFGWTVSVWPATNGHTVTDRDWAAVGAKLISWGAIHRRPGAKGCWFSHWRLWQHCIDLDQPIVILEHDAYISGQWPEDIDLTRCVWKLHLEDGRGERVNRITGEWSCGAYAYTMAPRFAKELMQFIRSHGAQAVDKQLGRSVIPWQYWHTDLAPHRPLSSSTTSKKTRQHTQTA